MMMSLATWSKAREFVMDGLVTVSYAHGNFIHFMVKDYDVYRRADKTWSCCSKYCSLFHNRENDCSHIRSCIMFLEGKDLEDDIAW